MTDLGHRLAADLRPRYAFVRLLGEGGMGTVFEFRDTLLGRAVAVKALKPEIAGAEAAERFIREARILAQVSHPNIVPIFDARQTSDGLHCIIMELVRGPTLASLIAGGPLPPTRVRDIGVQLLAALAHAHGHGVVHRDVKPSNVFVDGDRVLLADFGIAHSPHVGDDTLTRPGQRVGTPPYMAPEQRAARPAGPAADLYACALVLYEALTGHRLAPGEVSAARTWEPVPAGLVGPLRRALEEDPAARWPDAAAFRDALRRASPIASGSRRASFLGIAAMAVVLVAVLGWQWITADLRTERMPEPGADLAILDLDDEGAGTDGAAIARQLYSVLRQFPLVSVVRSDARDPERVTGARFVVAGRVRAVGADSLRARLEIHDSAGRIVESFGGLGRREALETLGVALADSLVCRVMTPHCQDFRDVRDLVDNPRAQKLFFEGEDAFTRGDWALAEQRFEAALERAPHYPIAAWNLMVAKRYQRKDFSADLQRLLAQFPELNSLYRGLAEAQLEPDLFTRFERYAALMRSYPTSGYALLLYYNERFHRGPLIGIPLAETLDSMSRLSLRIGDMHHTSQYDLTIWGYTRLGNEAAAKREFARRRGLAAPGDAYGPLHLHAIHSRFSPTLAWLERRWLGWRADSAALAVLAEKDRLGLSMDIPGAQDDLGRLLAERGWSLDQRATGVVGQALAQVALGRTARGLDLLDSAAAMLATPEMRLQQAEWPLALVLLGLPAPPARVAAARAALATRDEARAHFLLGLDAAQAGDTARADLLVARLRDDASEQGRRLGTLLAAHRAGASGRLTEALALSRAIYRLDSTAYALGPFARALTYEARGRWLDALGDADAADAAWMWYENSDMTGWPVGPPQQGEVDAMMTSYARLLRAELATRRGDAAGSCAHLARVRALWRDAEPAWAPLQARVRKAWEEARCR